MQNIEITLYLVPTFSCCKGFSPTNYENKGRFGFTSQQSSIVFPLGNLIKTIMKKKIMRVRDLPDVFRGKLVRFTSIMKLIMDAFARAQWITSVPYGTRQRVRAHNEYLPATDTAARSKMPCVSVCRDRTGQGVRLKESADSGQTVKARACFAFNNFREFSQMETTEPRWDMTQIGFYFNNFAHANHLRYEQLGTKYKNVPLFG